MFQEGEYESDCSGNCFSYYIGEYLYRYEKEEELEHTYFGPERLIINYHLQCPNTIKEALVMAIPRLLK